MSWTDRPWLSVDCETSGIDPYTDRIVEVAAALVHPDGTITDAWTTIVNPGITIPDIPAGIHGITTERATAEGCQPADALHQLADMIWQGNGIRPLVIYNAAFDWPLLLAEADRHGVEFPATAAVLDPLVLDKWHDRYRKGSRKLIDTAAHYGVELSEADAHGAAADAAASGLIMRRLVDTYPELGAMTLAGLQIHQTAAAEEQRMSFVKHRRTKGGEPNFDKAPGWPLPAKAVA